MNELHQKIIDAIVRKAAAVCPGSLALIGLYGSVATGDTYEKSDLDLLILINDERGWQLADGFILDDTKIGYDLYCTTWGMLESDAECSHAHLAKLMDSPLVYVGDQSAVHRLEQLRKKAAALLVSDKRFEKSQLNLDNAKKAYADCFLTDSIAEIRVCAGAVIYYLLDALMLFHGRYFRRGVKRTFEELGQLTLPFDAESKVMTVIRAESAEAIRAGLTDLLKAVQAHLILPGGKALPGRENLSGTYEEMFSNWRNKMQEAAGNGDLFSSFMNMASLQFMLQDISESVSVAPQNVMEDFDPHNPDKNLKAFDSALENHLAEYEKAGLHPRRFADAAAFLTDYLQQLPQ